MDPAQIDSTAMSVEQRHKLQHIAAEENMGRIRIKALLSPLFFVDSPF
jgi:hypothetical protein